MQYYSDSSRDADVPLLWKTAKNQNGQKSVFKYGTPLARLLIVIMTVALTICIYAISLSPEFNQYRLVRSYNNNNNNNNLNLPATRTILLWNNFFGSKRWNFPNDTMGPSYFRDELNCPVYQCELTNEHDFLPSVKMFDAILFHAAEPFPLWNSIPEERATNQLYIFALMEPPGETKHILSDEDYFYNLTMTYRLDSDIVWSYESIIDIATDIIVAPSEYPIWRSASYEWNNTEIWSSWLGKTKTAAWFVSHCKTLSERERLVAELQTYIDVDIYGKCGKLRCEYLSKECDDLLDQTYKFYLSFENSLCTDYVTEKLYNVMNRNVIPVVFGGANYTRFIPPHSYINAEDFENVEKLANYLKYLSSHPKEYSRYFWWRKYYKIAGGHQQVVCDLCKNLHSPTYRYKSQSYTNIEKWWLQGSCRFESKIQF